MDTSRRRNEQRRGFPRRADGIIVGRTVGHAAASIGAELLGYRVDELLGRGGMGVVYRAYDPKLKRAVAIKLLAPTLADDERFRERFLAETELAASLEHPNVVPIHDAGEDDGQLYLVMRFVEGGDLRRLLDAEAPLEPERAVAICSQVASALDAAHARGLVHRDVKPSNVLLDADGHAYLADFGLTGSLGEDGGAPPLVFLGTPAYVAPEQIRGEPVDGRADLYSLGCLLHECLSGEAPFARDSDAAVLYAHLEDEPPEPPGLEARDGAGARQAARGAIRERPRARRGGGRRPRAHAPAGSPQPPPPPRRRGSGARGARRRGRRPGAPRRQRRARCPWPRRRRRRGLERRPGDRPGRGRPDGGRRRRRTRLGRQLSRRHPLAARSRLARGHGDPDGRQAVRRDGVEPPCVRRRLQRAGRGAVREPRRVRRSRRREARNGRAAGHLQRRERAGRDLDGGLSERAAAGAQSVPDRRQRGDPGVGAPDGRDVPRGAHRHRRRGRCGLGARRRGRPAALADRPLVRRHRAHDRSSVRTA